MKKIIIIWLISAFAVFSICSEFEDFKLGEKQNFEGSKIFDDMVQSIGDIYNVKTLRTKGLTKQAIEYGTISFPVQVEVKFPDKLRIEFEDKEFIINDDNGWLKYPQGYYENLPEKYIKTINGNLNRNLINIAKSKADFKIELIAEKNVLDRECYELELSKNDFKITLFVDKKRHLPVRMTYIIDSNIIIRNYLEYKVIEGISYPIHTISTDKDDNLISEIVIEKVEFNAKIKSF